MAEALSQDEIDKLLTAVSTGDASGPAGDNVEDSVGNKKEPLIKIHDFRRPDKFTKIQIREMSYIHEMFAARAAALLGSSLRMSADVHCASVDQLTYEEFIRSIPNPALLAPYRFSPFDKAMLLEIDPALVWSMVDRLFGGTGAYSRVTRAVAPVEELALDTVLSPFGKILEGIWNERRGVEVCLEAAMADDHSCRFTAPVDMVVLVTLETRLDSVEGMMNICIPSRLAELLLAADKPEPFSDQADLSRLPVALETSIEGRELGVSELENLKEGDFIPLESFSDFQHMMLSREEESYARCSFTSCENKLTLMVEDVVLPVKRQKDPVRNNGKPKRPAPRTEAENNEQGPPDFQAVSSAEPSVLTHELLSGHPQYIACVLCQLDPPKAAELISALPSEYQSDVTGRIACMDMVNLRILRKTGKYLRDVLFGNKSSVLKPTGGIRTAAEILNLTDRATERNIIESLEEDDPELAMEIKKSLFQFGDIPVIDDRSFQRVLREIDITDLAKALTGASAEIREKVFRNMSQRAGAMLKEEMELSGPRHLSDVVHAQEKITSIIQKLEEQGDINIPRAGGSDLVEYTEFPDNSIEGETETLRGEANSDEEK